MSVGKYGRGGGRKWQYKNKRSVKAKSTNETVGLLQSHQSQLRKYICRSRKAWNADGGGDEDDARGPYNPTWQVPPEFIVSTAVNPVETISSAPHYPHAVAPTRATHITVRCCSTNAWVSRSFSSDTMRCDDDNDADNGDEDNDDDDNRLERRRWWKLIRIARAYSANMAIYYYYTRITRGSRTFCTLLNTAACTASDVISISRSWRENIFDRIDMNNYTK